MEHSSESDSNEQLSPEHREILMQTLEILFAAEDFHQITEEQQKVLLSIDTLSFLRHRLIKAKAEEDVESVEYLGVILTWLQDAQTDDFLSACERFVAEQQKAVSAIEALEAANTWQEFYHILEERQDILLSNMGLAVLRNYLGSLDKDGWSERARQVQECIELLEDARSHGLSAAWVRFMNEERKVFDSLSMLESAPTAEEFYRFLQEQQELLVSDLAIRLLREQAAARRKAGDVAIADHCDEHILLLEDACNRGLDAAWESMLAKEQQAIKAFEAVLSADSLEDIFRRLVEHERILVSGGALTVLRKHIDKLRELGDTESIPAYEHYLHVLEDARVHGMDVAWSNYLKRLMESLQEGMGEHAGQDIAKYSALLATFEPGTVEWAHVHYERGNAYYYSHLTGRRAENLEHAIADFSTALTVYTEKKISAECAGLLDSRGVAYLMYVVGSLGQGLDRLIHDYSPGSPDDLFVDPKHYLERSLEDFTAALALYKQGAMSMHWARALLKRATLYRLRILGNKVEDFQLALADYDAALTVFNEETTPLEWALARGNRGTAYLQLGGDKYEERARKGVADLEASLTVFTRAKAPALYRKMQVFRSQTFERLRQWANAHAALQEAIATQRDLLAAAISENERTSLIADFASAEMYLRDAQLLLRSEQANFKEVACLLEEGRAQNLRLALNLDTLQPERITDPAARARARAFIEAQKQWREQQHRATEQSAQLDASSNLVTIQRRKQLEQDLQKAHEAFLKTIEAIREYDDRDFLTPTPTFNDITSAVPTPDTALVYLAAGEENGLALLITRTDKTHNAQYIELPHFSKRAITDLLETDPANPMPIKLGRSLIELGERGLSSVTQALQQNKIKKVTFIPYGYLGLFPLPAVEVLLANEKRQRLGQLFEVTFAPSARAAQVAHQRASRLDRRTRPLLLIGGDPVPRPWRVEGLPYARAEADTVRLLAKSFGYAEEHICHLPSVQVTKEKVVEGLKRAWYAHLAVHGIYHYASPRRSRLVLAWNKGTPLASRQLYLGEALDGKIVDLAGLRLLVLSACETARIDIKQVPDEVLGLAAGFLQAGVAGVIASLWAVNDRATYLLMSRFAQLYLDPQQNWSPAGALVEAQRWLREEATNSVLATYDPTQPVSLSRTGRPLTKTRTSVVISSKQAKAALRSLSYDYLGTSGEFHKKATQDEKKAPDALPYADPFYWAAFVVTGS